MENHPSISGQPSAVGPSSKNQWISTFLLRLVGYALLLLTLVDVLSIVLPPQLLNPDWELKTIGSLVERAPIPLIGFALVANGGPRFRHSLDRYFFRVVPKLAMLVGLCFCLMIPLGVSDGLRLSNQNQDANTALTQQVTEIQDLQQRLGNAPASEVAEWAQKFQSQSSIDQDQEAMKTGVLAQLRANQANLQAQINQGTQGPILLQKRLTKWLVGALISGLSFLYIGKTIGKFSPVKPR